MRRAGLLLSAGFACGVALSCVKENPDHCSNRAGDATCVELYGDELPYCVGGQSCDGIDQNNGCVAELPSEACHDPCGADGECGDDTGTDGTGDTETDTGTDTDTTTGPACTDDDDCTDAAAPFCSPDGECVTCSELEDGDAACAEFDPAAPACDGEACVECTAENLDACTEDAPVCVEATCVPCSTHEQCPEGAGCNLAAGTCLLPVEHVDGDQSVADAFAALGGGDGTLVIHGGNHPGDLVIGAEQTVAIVGAPADAGTIAGAIDVEGTGSLYLDRITLDGNQVLDVLLEGAAHVQRSHLVSDSAAAVTTAGALVVRNSTIQAASDFVPVLFVNAGGSVVMTYSTLLNTTGGGLTTCDLPVLPISSIRNSLIGDLSDQNPGLCTEIAMNNNAFEQTADIPGQNTSVGDFDPAWFEADLHLTDQAPATIGIAAQWMDGDPTTDIDGDARELDGPGYAGADRP